MSSFLARMCATIETHGGDVDCFAGDALLVVFPVLPGGNGAPPCSEKGEELMDPFAGPALSMGAAVLSAKKCAIAICRELNGYRPTEAQPPLGIHAALAAGAVFATECGEQWSCSCMISCRSMSMLLPSVTHECDTSFHHSRQAAPRLLEWRRSLQGGRCRSSERQCS